jgi:predicted small metal-binding protein
MVAAECGKEIAAEQEVEEKRFLHKKSYHKECALVEEDPI